MPTKETPERYIRRIRNLAKREYAERVYAQMLGGGAEPERGALSYMAAQAVRLNLAYLVRWMA